MFENWHWQYLWGIACFANYMICIFMMGMNQFRHGELEERATGQAMILNQANLVNANANTGEVTVSGKSVKFSARTAKRQSLAV